MKFDFIFEQFVKIGQLSWLDLIISPDIFNWTLDDSRVLSHKVARSFYAFHIYLFHGVIWFGWGQFHFGKKSVLWKLLHI